MKNVLASTKLYKNYQIAIPKVIRNKIKDLNKSNIILDWGFDDESGCIIIKQRKKVELDDVLGIIDDDGDSIDIDKLIYE